MSSSQLTFTPRSTIIHANVYTARDYKNDGNFKYSVKFVFTKAQYQSGELNGLLEAYNEVLVNDFNGNLPDQSVKFAYIDPNGKEVPFTDGARKHPDNPYYADKLILTASNDTDHPPGVFMYSNPPVEILDRSQIYSGIEGVGQVTFYGFKGGAGGISCSLHGVMKTNDGERVGGETIDAKAGFAEFAQQNGAPAANQAPAPAANQAPAPAANQGPSPAANQAPAPAANQAPSPAANQAPAPEPSGPQLTDLAIHKGYTYDGFIQQGWTEAQMREQGYLV